MKTTRILRKVIVITILACFSLQQVAYGVPMNDCLATSSPGDGVPMRGELTKQEWNAASILQGDGVIRALMVEAETDFSTVASWLIEVFNGVNSSRREVLASFIDDITLSEKAGSENLVRRAHLLGRAHRYVYYGVRNRGTEDIVLGTDSEGNDVRISPGATINPWAMCTVRGGARQDITNLRQEVAQAMGVTLDKETGAPVGDSPQAGSFETTFFNIAWLHETVGHSEALAPVIKAFGPGCDPEVFASMVAKLFVLPSTDLSREERKLYGDFDVILLPAYKTSRITGKVSPKVVDFLRKLIDGQLRYDPNILDDKDDELERVLSAIGIDYSKSYAFMDLDFEGNMDLKIALVEAIDRGDLVPMADSTQPDDTGADEPDVHGMYDVSGEVLTGIESDREFSLKGPTGKPILDKDGNTIDFERGMTLDTGAGTVLNDTIRYLADALEINHILGIGRNRQEFTNAVSHAHELGHVLERAIQKDLGDRGCAGSFNLTAQGQEDFANLIAKYLIAGPNAWKALTQGEERVETELRVLLETGVYLSEPLLVLVTEILEAGVKYEVKCVGRRSGHVPALTTDVWAAFERARVPAMELTQRPVDLTFRDRFDSDSDGETARLAARTALNAIIKDPGSGVRGMTARRSSDDAAAAGAATFVASIKDGGHLRAMIDAHKARAEAIVNDDTLMIIPKGYLAGNLGGFQDNIIQKYNGDSGDVEITDSVANAVDMFERLHTKRDKLMIVLKRSDLEKNLRVQELAQANADKCTILVLEDTGELAPIDLYRFGPLVDFGRSVLAGDVEGMKMFYPLLCGIGLPADIEDQLATGVIAATVPRVDENLLGIGEEVEQLHEQYYKAVEDMA